MRRLQHEVLRAIHERRLLLRVASPKHEDDRLGLFVDQPHHRVGEALPPALAVRCGLPHLDRKHAVEEEHALACPMFEEAVAAGEDTEVALHLLENVDEARRRPDPRHDREAQAMRLAFAMIGVLPEDDDAHLVERSQVERPEPVGSAREDCPPLLPLPDKESLQLAHVRLLEFRAQRAQPAGVKFDLPAIHFGVLAPIFAKWNRLSLRNGLPTISGSPA